MASKDNFTSLKELYDHIVAAKRAPQWIIYGGEEFFRSSHGMIHVKAYGNLEYRNNKGKIIFDPRLIMMIHYTGNKRDDWYSPLELLSKDNVERTMETIVRHLMKGYGLWWIGDSKEVVFIEAIRNNIKDAVEIWEYIISTVHDHNHKDQAFIERISDGLRI